MYHNKNDKRFEKSSELLYQGLIHCIKKKNFADISVSDISRISTVGRATFYRNFDNITDILYWKCSQQFSEMLTVYVEQKVHLNEKLEFLQHVFRYWAKNSETLECILKINRIDIIYKCLIDNSHILINYLEQKEEFPELHYDYFTSIRIGIFIGIIDTWIKNGKTESPEEIADIIEEQIKITMKYNLIF